MTTSKTIRCASALRLIWLGRLSFKLHYPSLPLRNKLANFRLISSATAIIHIRSHQGISLQSIGNKFKLWRILPYTVESTGYALTLWQYHFSPDTRSARKRTTHYTTHIKLPATSTKFHTANTSHAALFRAVGCGAHRRISCVHAKFIFVDRARRVHCGNSCFWPSHHHGLSPTAYAPKFRRASLV